MRGVLGAASNILSNTMRLKSALSNVVEPDFGLLDELLRLSVLTGRQYDDIRSEKRAAYRRSEAVLDLLETEDQCDNFVIALQRTDQQHVVNFITQNGGHRHCYNIATHLLIESTQPCHISSACLRFSLLLSWRVISGNIDEIDPSLLKFFEHVTRVGF